MRDNELIAEFMGYHVYDDELFGQTVRVYSIKTDDSVRRTLNRHHVNQLKYDTDWNWLMPVVEKITGIPYESEEVDNGFGVKVTVVQRPYLRTFGMINDENGDYMARFNRCALHMAPTLIEATYSAVVEFIKWYNQQGGSK